MPFEKIRDELAKELPDLNMDGEITKGISSGLGQALSQFGKFAGQFLREFSIQAKRVIVEMRKKN